MSLYARVILPRLIDLACRNEANTAERSKLLPLASGTVLEIGAGSGLNIPFYRSDIHRLYALEPSVELRKMAEARARAAPFPIEFLSCSAEDIPLGAGTVDTVVSTWTLCSILDVGRAVEETARVLKPGGRLVFVEHGRSPETRVAAWQDRLNPLWRRLAGGCNLNRKIDDLIAAAYTLREIHREYGRGPKPLVYLYKGIAERR